MFVRALRQQSRLSQEQLAESSGLSLRTVQRVEAGHRVSYASMRALARVFDVDVDKLELELYAMDKSDADYRELPLWVRLMLGRGWVSSSRRELCLTEVVLVVLGTVLGLVFVANRVFPVIHDPQDSALYTSWLMFLFAYLVSVFIRVGDKYSAWPSSERTGLRRFFGLAGKNPAEKD